VAAEKDAFDWVGDTWPFTGHHGALPANFTLRQVSDDDFVAKHLRRSPSRRPTRRHRPRTSLVYVGRETQEIIE